MDLLFEHWEVVGRAAGLTAGAVLTGLLAHAALFGLLLKVARRKPSLLFMDGLLLKHSRAPFRLMFPVFAVYLLLPLITEGVQPGAVRVLENVLYLLVAAGLMWLLVRLTFVVEEWIARRFSIENDDNLTARKVRTQTAILRRIVIVAIVVVSLAAVLLRYDGFRQFGTGLLASAGIVGIIVGLAAQRTLGNLLAGLQIAISQPIRVEDVVIVEGEWGRIEEITLTYVVVRIWDMRRLVLPISHFIDKPFQNWTRTSAHILGTVFLYVDYTVPVEAVRRELQRLVEASEYWDGQLWRLHVTDATERTVELRALMSAANSSAAFELRCEVREKLVAFIQEHHPYALPTLRTRIEPEAPGAGRDGGYLAYSAVPVPHPG